MALHAAPDLVSLSASIGEDDAELGDVLADNDAESPFDAAAVVAGPRRPRQRCSSSSTRASGRSCRCASGSRATQPLTLDEVGRQFNVTRERIRQIEAKALTKLRHPCSARQRRLVSALGR